MKSNRKTIKTLLVALVTIVVLKAAYELKWFDVILGIFKIETGGTKVQNISVKSFAFVCKSTDENYFIDFMTSKNWVYVRSYGRGLLFEKDGYELIITKNQFFGRYSFYEVTSKTVFEMV